MINYTVNSNQTPYELNLNRPQNESCHRLIMLHENEYISCMNDDVWVTTGQKGLL